MLLIFVVKKTVIWYKNTTAATDSLRIPYISQQRLTKAS